MVLEWLRCKAHDRPLVGYYGVYYYIAYTIEPRNEKFMLFDI